MKEIIDPFGDHYMASCEGLPCYKCGLRDHESLCWAYRKLWNIEMEIKPMLRYIGGRIE